MSPTTSNFADLADFPFLAAMQPHLEALQAEAREVMARFNYLRWRYPTYFGRQNPGMTGARGTFYLQIYGMQLTRNQALCPVATRVVENVPGLVTAAVYLLDAHARITPHTGATDTVWRGHMGLICPPGAAIRVGDETRAWSEGGFLVFDDTVDHEAWNDGDRMRAILLFDFFKAPHDADERQRRLYALRERYLGALDHRLILATDPVVEPDFLERMRAMAADVPAVGTLPAAAIEPIVRESGLYFT